MCWDLVVNTLVLVLGGKIVFFAFVIALLRSIDVEQAAQEVNLSDA